MKIIENETLILQHFYFYCLFSSLVINYSYSIIKNEIKLGSELNI